MRSVVRQWESIRLSALSSSLISRCSSRTSSPSGTSIYCCSAALELEAKALVFAFLLFWIYQRSKTSRNNRKYNRKFASAGRSGHRGSQRLLSCWCLWLCCCCSLLAVWFYPWCWRPGSVWKRVSVYLTSRCRTWEMTWSSMLTWIETGSGFFCHGNHHRGSRAWILMVVSEGGFGLIRPQKRHLRLSLLPLEELQSLWDFGVFWAWQRALFIDSPWQYFHFLAVYAVAVGWDGGLVRQQSQRKLCYY